MARKQFIPLESDPILFTELLHKLGVSDDLSFVDVLSLDDPDLLAIIPRPVLGLIFIFPGTETTLASVSEVEKQAVPYTGSGEDEDIVWFRQTIGNACGLYALLHTVCNGKAREHIRKQPHPADLPRETGTTLDKLLKSAIPLSPEDQAHLLESSTELEAAHSASAHQGQSSVPTAQVHTPFHYDAFVKSHKSGNLYELAGYWKGPRDLGRVLTDEEDLLSDNALAFLKQYVERELKAGGDLSWGFNLMALVPTQN
ncbi:peptidase C12 ubiquitin carboxyl-terminal hydrolase 1 [Dacryopinax primogenitus]|uniref:Ubiquitin carboxyl-terminal hydrolase n=1 Tax=Dacryopinax primogenitus (strain DJM 731) TaxID=1858805 RepID=M5FN37_DACPD|nr:peptidase C12 ubiquitin carboxyl-terminal hydrolase 1 [Dacryopinax primogenitus]EJT96765.1 peptidase C12 ubiquitin carboxyl-terminal hydrolase 1 [Dacryopinax primogenitus]